MSSEVLADLLENGDAEKCVAFFHGMPEKQRRALASQCAKWLKDVRKNEMIETVPGRFSANPLLKAAEVAVFATATYSEIEKLPWHVAPSDDFVYDILTDRRPDWAENWAITLLEGQYYWSDWQLIRRLIAAGLATKPDHPNYYLAMISGITGRYEEDATIQQRLLENPELLDDEVWRLFEYEGGGENSLANWDRFARGQTWADALLALTKDGHLPRERLLSCSLDALERDFNHYRAKWFASFYDALEPSAEEQAEHAERLLHLLASAAPNIVSWAFQKVQKLTKSGLYPPRTLIAGLEPVLQARQKGIVTKALKLIRLAVKDSPEIAPVAARGATLALGHEAADVQEAALDLIDRFASAGDEQLASRLADYAEAVAPSLRRRLEEWSGTSVATPDSRAATAPQHDPKVIDQIGSSLRPLFSIDAILECIENGRLKVPSATFDGTDIPRLDPRLRLEPIEDLDELIEVCSRVIEEPSLVDDAERAIDGLSRLCDVRPDDFPQRIGPLLNRATQRLKKGAPPFVAMGPGHDLCGLAYAWGKGLVLGTKITKEPEGASVVFEVEGHETRWWTQNLNKPIGALSRRSAAVAGRVANRQPAVLLSATTHEGGWIDPAALVERVNGWTGGEPDMSDICLALLRLAPDGRKAALDQLEKKTSEWQRAIRYALGGERITVGKSAALWMAAARSRSPWSDDNRIDKAFPKRGPDAGLAATYSFHCKTRERKHTDLYIDSKPPSPKKVDAESITVAFHSQRSGARRLRWELGGFAGRDVGAVRWTATVWPLARESFFAAAANEMADNLDWWEAMWQNQALLEPLLDSGTPLRSMGLLLLAIGLAAKEPGEHGLATDIAIQTIEDGRLGSDNLGAILAELLPTGLVKPGRWLKTLSDVARVSPVHALVLQQALQTALQGAPKKMPRDYGKLLELLKELSIELGLGITDEACREFLGSIAGSGKAAKSAKALLALEPIDSPEVETRLMEQVLNQRITAAMERQTMASPT